MELTREQAIEIAGLELVEAAEKEHADYAAQDELYIWYSSHMNNDKYIVKVYYKFDKKEFEETDFDNLNWRIHSYSVYTY